MYIATTLALPVVLSQLTRSELVRASMLLAISLLICRVPAANLDVELVWLNISAGKSLCFLGQVMPLLIDLLELKLSSLLLSFSSFNVGDIVVGARTNGSNCFLSARFNKIY